MCEMEKVCSINVHVQFLCRLDFHIFIGAEWGGGGRGRILLFLYLHRHHTTRKRKGTYFHCKSRDALVPTAMPLSLVHLDR